MGLGVPRARGRARRPRDYLPISPHISPYLPTSPYISHDLEHEAELVVLDRAPLDEAERAQHLQAAAVAGHGRLEVRIEQADRAEALVLRVRHHVGAEQQQRLG